MHTLKRLAGAAAFCVLAVAAAPLAAQQLATSKFTPNSNIAELDNLKQYYFIPNFRIGGSYNLDADPETWRNGGEGGTTPALAVVVNAIVDALAEFGVRHIEMPATPERVWRAIRDARLR